MVTKNQKIVLMILLILVAAGGYGAWTVFVKPKTDPTANWQIYRNEEYGYEVKYPKNWKLWNEFAPFDVRFYHPDYYLEGHPAREGKWFLAVVIIHYQDTNESWQETALRTMTRKTQGMIVESSFQGEKAYGLTECPGSFLGTDSEYCTEEIWFSHPHKDIVLYFSVEKVDLFPTRDISSYEYEKEKKAIIDVFNQMLSTFRFLE